MNLLALGDIIDSKRLPTLLFVEPVSTKVQTFPVNRFSFPILKSTQLSFFMPLSFLRVGLDDVRRGDYTPEMWLLQRAGTVSTSSPSSKLSLKQLCFKASEELILSRGFFFSIFLRRSRALGSSFSQTDPSKQISLCLFCLRISLYVFPGKTLYPISKMWKMSPKLKMSQMGSYLVLISLMLMTSGATQPGVPHRTKRYVSASANQERPKSAITQSQLPGLRKIRFQGLRSRCMILLLCISCSPLRMENMICFTS